MKQWNRLGTAGVLLALALGSVPASAQRTPSGTVATTPTRSATAPVTPSAVRSRASANAKKPIDARTAAEIDRRMREAFAGMDGRSKMHLSYQLWALYHDLADKGPYPDVTPQPPVEPPAAVACVDCGKRAPIPGDPCGKLRAESKDISDKMYELNLARDLLQAGKQKLVDLDFYGGIASLGANIVTTTVTLVTAGGGAGLSKAALGALKEIAIDAIKEAVMDALADALPAPLDAAVSGKLTEAMITEITGALTAKIKALADQKKAKVDEINACFAKYKADQKSVNEANAAVVACMKQNPNYCL